jgi:hypothetical protein
VKIGLLDRECTKTISIQKNHKEEVEMKTQTEKEYRQEQSRRVLLACMIAMSAIVLLSVMGIN